MSYLDPKVDLASGSARHTGTSKVEDLGADSCGSGLEAGVNPDEAVGRGVEAVGPDVKGAIRTGDTRQARTLLEALSDQVSRKASALASVLRFSVCGEHPKRFSIVAAYFRLQARLGVARLLGGATLPRRFALLGTELQFADVRTFNFLLKELFIEGTYMGFEHSPATIVDCGSNIGLSILLFKSLWPHSTITGIEASPETFAFLRQNVRDLPGVNVVNKAVGDQRGVVSFYSGPIDLFGSTNALRGGSKQTIVESAPLSEFITGPIDLLKVDIEGSEAAAFAELEASGKMPLIGRMFIEYHHQLPDETHRLSTFLDRLERCGFNYELAASLPKRPGDFQDVLIRAERNQ